ncbi:MAG: rRNA maturation RNase YbeY [Acaryochloridaceae cyanobacterium SU_2_1]|nr:rRNA maturation RNase YbeY [Acaryochloridaceae cyanobacterium SU_2_1]
MDVTPHLQWHLEDLITPTMPAAEQLAAASLKAAVLEISHAPWPDWFNQWFVYLGPDLSPMQAYELSLRFTNDAEIRSLNALYRHQDRPTDVLAFACLDLETPLILETEEPLELGDIVISVETAARQATQHQHSLSQELVWLASHGLLHLLGWDHPDQAQLDRMLAQQDQLLQQIGFVAMSSGTPSSSSG